MANKFNLLKIDDESDVVDTDVVDTEKVDTEKVSTEKVSTEKVETEKVETEKVSTEKVSTEVEECDKLKEYDPSSDSDSDESDSDSEESDEESDEESENKKRWCACSLRHSDDESDEESESEEDNTNFIYVLYDNDRVKTYSECYDKLNEYLEKMIKETTTKYIHLGEIYVHPEIKKDGDYYKLFFIQKNMFWKTETVLKIFSIKKVYHL